MKCEEALTKIEAYINHTLNGRELEEFLEHVTSCQECYDELETYYIISVGMRYLEEENLESYNIPKMLQEDLHTRERRVRRRNILRKTAVLLGVAFFHSDTGSGTFLSGTSGTAQIFLIYISLFSL